MAQKWNYHIKGDESVNYQKIKSRKIFICAFALMCLFGMFMSGAVTAQEDDADHMQRKLRYNLDNFRDSVVIDVLDLKNMDILDVLRLIAQKSGMNIVAGKNVTGRVNVYLKDIDSLKALEIIADANGWALAHEGDVIKVMTAAEFESKYGYKFGMDVETRVKKLEFTQAADMLAVLNQVKNTGGKVISDEKTGTLVLMDTPEKLDEMEKIIREMDVSVRSEVFTLSYAKAEDLSAKISEALTPGVGTMRFDARTNTVIVSDSLIRLNKIQQIIDAFDVKDREVLIKAKIIQVTLSDTHKLGIDWAAIVKDSKALTFTSDFDILTETDKKGKVSVGTLSEDQYTATLEALDTIGNTNILSAPSVTVVNNQEAKILVGSNEPYVTTTTTTPSSGPTTTAESVQFVEVGVKLFVTPTIHRDDFITMKIKPEVSSVTSNLTTSNNNTIPIVETSEAETTVMVKDGVTIVIGGLIKEENIIAKKRVPYLANIPVLGAAFRNNSDEVSNTEIAIFLTPNIITGDIHASADMKRLGVAEK